MLYGRDGDVLSDCSIAVARNVEGKGLFICYIRPTFAKTS